MTLQASGAISLAQIQTEMGGANPISMSEYYKGGAYTPSTIGSTTRQPTSGEYYSLGAPEYYWIRNDASGTIAWAGATITSAAPAASTSYTAGTTTYYRGVANLSFPPTYYHGVYRIINTSQSVNASVPTSGTISFSNFYGARNS